MTWRISAKGKQAASICAEACSLAVFARMWCTATDSRGPGVGLAPGGPQAPLCQLPLWLHESGSIQFYDEEASRHDKPTHKKAIKAAAWQLAKAASHRR
jgi:hypothetical protein